MISSFRDETKICMVLEFCPDRTIGDLMKTYDDKVCSLSWNSLCCLPWFCFYSVSSRKTSSYPLCWTFSCFILPSLYWYSETGFQKLLKVQMKLSLDFDEFFNNENREFLNLLKAPWYKTWKHSNQRWPCKTCRLRPRD